MRSRIATILFSTFSLVAAFIFIFYLRLDNAELAVELAEVPAERGIQGGARVTEEEIEEQPTATPQVGLIATLPNTFTPIPSITNTPPPGASLTPTPRNTPTPIIENTPTVAPTPDTSFSELDDDERIEAAPTPVEMIEVPRGVTNILLIGSDTPTDVDAEVSIRTDSLIIVSINRREGTASMISIPRDLYVFIPGWANNRINSAYAHGNQSDYPGGGIKLLKDTILYNFGIPIHYYAQIDFSGFEGIVDSVGGIEIINSCELTDWRLKEPGLDIQEEDNWEMFTLEPGVHKMDGFTALWYARSRRTTSDFDRGRRQQQIMDAIFEKGLDLNLLSQAPSVWDSFQQTVKTDMDFGKALQLAAVAPAVQEKGIQHLSLTRGEIQGYTVPESGASVSVLVPDQASKTFSKLYDVSALNRSARQPISVELINGSSNPDLPIIVASTLEWFGIVPIISDGVATAEEPVSVEYFGENFKGSYHRLVGWVFGIPLNDIELTSGKLEPFSYKVTLGDGYSACRNTLYAPGG